MVGTVYESTVMYWVTWVCNKSINMVKQFIKMFPCHIENLYMSF